MSEESRKSAVTPNGAAVVEQVVIKGNLADLTAKDRVTYYAETCRSLGLNPLTQPFQYISLNGKLVLYATRGATDQLRAVHHVAITKLERETVGDVFMVTASARLPDGRTDESIGAVSIKGLIGDALANAFMKAETKSKRRVTLSIVGLGFLDESEIETIPLGQTVAVNTETGEIETSTARLSPAKAQPVQPRPPAATESDPWDDASALPLPPDRAELGSIQAREIAEMGQHPQPATNGDKVTPDQLRFIFTLARAKKKLTDEQVGAMAHQQFGRPVEQLSKREASDLITALKAQEP